MIYTPYLWPKLIAAIIPIGFALYMRHFRQAPAARPFSRLMGLTALWALCHALNTSTVSLSLRLFWSHLQIVPFVLIAPTVLTLALEYCGQEHQLTRRRRLLLLIVPALTILLEWTSAYHTLYRYSFSMDFSGVSPVLRSDKGVWYWVNIGYAYALITAACWRLLRAFRPGTPYFWSAAIMSVCIVLPFLVDFLYMVGITPIRDYNLSSTMFVFTGALQIWAILRFRMFDLIPIAREILLEQMREGVVVLDSRNRMVDVNAAAAVILGMPRSSCMGQELLIPALREFTGAGAGAPDKRLPEMALGQRRYQISSSPLFDRQGSSLGRLLILHDITDLKQSQTKAVAQQRALAMMEERVRLARELHDGLGQVLGYVKMRAHVARDLLAEGQLAEVDAYLANLIAVTQDAHTDIREYLLGVQAAGASETDFLGALQQYLAQFSRNYGIHTELAAPSTLRADALEPTAVAQLLRIIQEALTNARKYAQAAHILVSFTTQEDHACVLIQDDGRGFDPLLVSDAGATYGLRFMRERAEELHGSLAVQSEPGQGTRIIVRVPLRRIYANFTGG